MNSDRPEDSKASQLQIRIREDLKEDLRATAEFKGLTVSSLIHSLIVKAVRDAKKENPEAFGLVKLPASAADQRLKDILYEGFRDEPVDPDILKRAIDLIIATRRSDTKDGRKSESKRKMR